IRLPAEVGAMQPVAAVRADAQPMTVARPSGSSTILVIDDDPSVLALTERFLTRERFTVVTANGGRDGLKLARELHPAAITLVEMRARAEWRNIPVVVVTAKDLTADERARLNGDVERVLQKGASEVDALLTELGRILPRSIERMHNDNVTEAPK